MPEKYYIILYSFQDFNNRYHNPNYPKYHPYLIQAYDMKKINSHTNHHISIKMNHEKEKPCNA